MNKWQKITLTIFIYFILNYGVTTHACESSFEPNESPEVQTYLQKHTIDWKQKLTSFGLIIPETIVGAKNYYIVATPMIAAKFGIESFAPHLGMYPRLAILTSSAYLGFRVVWHYAKKHGYATTARPSFNYFISMRLLGMNLKGKKILDVGAGRSRFGQIINWLYKKYDTKVTSLDIQSNVMKSKDSVVGDMFDLKFKPREFDLILSNHSFSYYCKQPRAADAISGMIDITKDGGEIRLRFIKGKLHEDAHQLLSTHPRIKSHKIIKRWPNPGISLLIIKLKEE